MEGNGGQVRAEGTAISSTASDDVDMMDGQDQETVAGSGTHLGGLVAQKRTKVKNSNASEKVTADVLARRILDYGIVKAEKATNVVWHYFRKSRNLRRNVPPWIPCGCKIMSCVCCAWNLKIRSVVSMSQ